MLRVFYVSLWAMVVAGLLAGCQKNEKRYFSSSPEIDLIKKGEDSYRKGDWAAVRAMYSDSAVIFFNNWQREVMTADQLVERLKADVADYKAFDLARNAVHEMIINDKGEHWVNYWTEWQGYHKNGKYVKMVYHVTSHVRNGKVVMAAYVFNGLPEYLVAHSDSIPGR